MNAYVAAENCEPVSMLDSMYNVTYFRLNTRNLPDLLLAVNSRNGTLLCSAQVSCLSGALFVVRL